MVVDRMLILAFLLVPIVAGAQSGSPGELQYRKFIRQSARRPVSLLTGCYTRAGRVLAGIVLLWEVDMVVNRSAPRATVVPVLVYEDVGRAIDWLCDTFGFRERLRAGSAGGDVVHAQLEIGDCAVMLGRQGGEFRVPPAGHVNQYLVVHVANVDAHCAHARQCGARILKQPTDMPFGERQYTAEDCGGHRWTFSQSIQDVAPEDWGATENRAG